ncbi:hypothetical protein TNCV_4839601 [Trichonephila clavipes]|nr:hypothetical protein TNCV_4839601 [Trichonephila clavipes]
MVEPNVDQAPQNINKEEFQLERVRLQTFVASTDRGCKKELIRICSVCAALTSIAKQFTRDFSPMAYNANFQISPNYSAINTVPITRRPCLNITRLSPVTSSECSGRWR